MPAGVASVMRLVAALGGIAIAFVVVMLVQALSPTPGLHEGEGTVTFARFGFDAPRESFTVGSVVTLNNDGAVPATLRVQAPDGSLRHLALAPGASGNVTVAEEGTYAVSVLEWPWAAQDWRVRSDDSFVRFFEDLF